MRARQARDQIALEKQQLLDKAWKGQQALALDRVHQRIVTAREQLAERALAAADQGKDEVVLLKLSFEPCDLRHLVRDELHSSQTRQPDPYPKLRALGPPSFATLEGWLRNDLGVKEMQNLCALDWLVALHQWAVKREGRGWLTRWTQLRPALPQALEDLWQQCLKAGLKPEFRAYKVFEDAGVALKVCWTTKKAV
jgi:hypothetical protein